MKSLNHQMQCNQLLVAFSRPPDENDLLELTGVKQLDNLQNGRFRLRSEEHTSELQSHHDLVCRLLLEKKKDKHMFVFFLPEICDGSVIRRIMGPFLRCLYSDGTTFKVMELPSHPEF